MRFILLVLFLALTYAQKQCLSLNANVEVQHASRYRQFIQDTRPLNDKHALFVQHGYDVNYDTMAYAGRGSFLGKANLLVANKEVYDGRPVNYLIEETVVEGLLNPNVTNAPSVLFGLSNTVTVKDLYSKEPKDAVLTIVNVLAPSANNANVSSINFMIVDGNLNVPTVDKKVISPIKSLNNTFGSLQYQIYESTHESYYNEKGVIVGTQSKDDPYAANVNFQAVDLESISHQKILSVRLLSAQKNDHEFGVKVDFVAMVNTQDSIKLVRYIALTSRDEAAQTSPYVTATRIFHKVVVPRVVNDAGVTHTSAGGVLEVTSSQIMIAASISLAQKAAFEVSHPGVILQFAPGQSRAPFLIRVDIATGDVLWATNIASADSATASFVDGYPAAMDLKDGVALIVNNIIDVPSHTRNDYEESQRAYISNVRFSVPTNMSKVVQSVDSVVDDRDRKHRNDDEQKRVRFVAYGVSFSMDGADDKFLVGGTVGDYTSNWKVGGRLALLSYNLDAKSPAVLKYGQEIGYYGSNIVKFTRRVFVNADEGEHLQIAMYLNGPDTKPPSNPVDDKYRNVKTSFWLEDCSPPDYNLEKAFTIVFYTVFSVVAFSMLTAITTFSIKGILLYRKNKGDKQEEQRSLLAA